MTFADPANDPSRDLVDVTVERGRTLLQLHRPLDAERELRGALAREPQNALAHALLSVALTAQHRSTEAIAAANAAVGCSPEWWFTHFAAGQALHAAGSYDEAVRAGRAAMVIDPEDPSVWQLLAQAHLSKGEAWDAGQAAWEGLRRAPDDNELAALLALAMTELGRSPEALAHADQSVRLDPEDSFGHIAYGYAALGASRPADAVEAFRAALRLDPGNDAVEAALVEALKKCNPLYRSVSGLVERVTGTRVWLPFVVWGGILVLRWAQLALDSVLTLRMSGDPVLRPLVSSQRRTARRAALALGCGTVLLGTSLVLWNPVPAAAGLVALALVTPIQEAANVESVRMRRFIAAWTVLLCLATAALAALSFQSADDSRWAQAMLLMAGTALIATLIAS